MREHVYEVQRGPSNDKRGPLALACDARGEWNIAQSKGFQLWHRSCRVRIDTSTVSGGRRANLTVGGFNDEVCQLREFGGGEEFGFHVRDVCGKCNLLELFKKTPLICSKRE